MQTTSTEMLRVGGRSFETQRIAPGRDACGRAEGERPTLVFLHEGLGTVAMWKGFPAMLVEATGCPAFLYSRLGYGGSDPCEMPRPLDYMQREGEEVLPEVLDAAGVGDYILVGHSDGGSIALVNAGCSRAKRVRAVVTIAGHVFCEQVSVDSIRSARRQYVQDDLRERLKRYHGENVDNAFYGWNDTWLDACFMEWNIEEYLKKITVPVMAVQGELDQYGTEAQLRSIAAHVPGGARVMLVPGCGHSPHLEKPAEVSAAIAPFIGEFTA